MQQFKEKLAKLVRSHKESPQVNLQVLESDFIQLIAETLSAPPLTEESIKQLSKPLFLQFHTDKSASFSPEVQWIESTLSNGENDGACFKIIGLCRDRLIESKNRRGEKFENAENIGDLRSIFVRLRKEANTKIQRDFYDSLIDLIDECSRYDKKIANIQSRHLKITLQYLPAYAPQVLISIFHTEIIALYAIGGLSALFGYSLQKCTDNTSLNALGSKAMEGGIACLSGSSMVLLRMYEMSYWICGNSYDLALQVIAPPETRYFFHAFQSERIENITRPFQSYLKLNEQQYFRDARLGSTKRELVLKFLEHARNIDDLKISEAEKIEKIKISVDKMASFRQLNTSKLAVAIKEAYILIEAEKAPLLLTF